MSRVRALVVEDNSDLAEMMVELLETFGMEAVAEHNGVNALRFIQRQIPDLVMLDWHVPMMSGQDIIRAIRSDSALAHIRVVLFSADAQVIENEYQADLVLIKPINLDELQQVTQWFDL
jgi:CheY-like chemotaxis protein